MSGRRAQCRGRDVAARRSAARRSSGSSDPDPRRVPPAALDRAQRRARASPAAAVVQQRGDDGDRDTPPLAGLCVDEPDLEVSLRSDLREQGRQVVGEVVGGGRRPIRDCRPSQLQPGPERQTRPVPSRTLIERRTSINGASSAQRAQAPRQVTRRLCAAGPRSEPGRGPARRPAGCSSSRSAARRGEGSWRKRPPAPDRSRAAGPSGSAKLVTGAGAPRGALPAGWIPASTLTCTEAVEHIMVRPAGPQPSRYRSIATYLGSSVMRRDGRIGSRRSRPARRRAGRRAGGVRPDHWRTALIVCGRFDRGGS